MSRALLFAATHLVQAAHHIVARIVGQHGVSLRPARVRRAHTYRDVGALTWFVVWLEPPVGQCKACGVRWLNLVQAVLDEEEHESSGVRCHGTPAAALGVEQPKLAAVARLPLGVAVEDGGELGRVGELPTVKVRSVLGTVAWEALEKGVAVASHTHTREGSART